ncbi:MAG: hypothetical protein ACI4MS_06425 [Candidatus Coproplasma sp.]
MRKVFIKFTYAITALTVVLVFIFSSLLGGGVGSAYAATSTNISFDTSDIMDDLKTCTIDGKKFSPADYPYDSTGIIKHPEIFTVVEYCYSFSSSNRNNYGLYVYFYNPSALNISTTSKSNKISLGVKYVNDDLGNVKVEEYEKFDLLFCSKSEGDLKDLYYKFKIIDHESSDGKTIVDRVNSLERRYDISEIELLTVGDINATAYGVGGTFTFTGYAKGYGWDTEAESTLTCSRVDLETITLDVYPTYFRPEGTYNDGYTQDTLHSVYFSVPNEILDNYGDMTAVHATWLNAQTAPIFVTGNSTVFNALFPFLATYVSGGTAGDYYSPLEYALVATKAVDNVKLEVMAANYGYYAYNCYLNGTIESNFTPTYDNFLQYLNYIFLADNKDADNYVLSAEKLLGDKINGVKGWLQTFTEEYGDISQYDWETDTYISGMVNDKYSRVLFDSVDSEFTDVKIQSTDEYHLTDNTISDTLWTRLFGGSLKAENSYDISAIQKVVSNDISLYSTKSAFCNKFYIAESDYDNFTDYVINAESQNKTVYLFRYYQSEYVSHEVSEFKRTTKWSASTFSNLGSYEGLDTNAYFCQGWLQLDFDIIDLTFTKEGKETVITVAMSPLDLGADFTPPVDTTSDGFDWKKLLAIILGFVILIILICVFAPVLIPILGYVVKAVVWVVCLPFKLIKKLFKKKE